MDPITLMMLFQAGMGLFGATGGMGGSNVLSGLLPAFAPVGGGSTPLGNVPGAAGQLGQLGSLLGSVGSLFGGGGGGSRRHKRINQTRLDINVAGQKCAEYGVGSPQCPRSTVDYWLAQSRSRFPNWYRSVWSPLATTGRSQWSVQYMQSLGAQYLGKRQGASTYQQYAQTYAPYIGGGSVGGGYGYSAGAGVRLRF